VKSVMRRALLLLSLALLPLFGADGAAVQVRLRAAVRLAAAHATLADLAELDGPVEVVKALSPIVIQDLPGPGPYLVDAPKVRMALGRQVAAGDLAITGQCRLERRMRLISEAELTAAAVAAARGGPGETEIAVVRAAPPLTILDNATAPTLLAEALDTAPSGEISFRVRVVRDGLELGRGLVVLHVSRFQVVPVATRALARGEEIGLGDVDLRRVAMTRQIQDALATAEAAIGQQARAGIAAGTPLTAALLRPRTAVRGGQTVTLVVNTDQFRVTASGEALADGGLGDEVLVRRGADGRAVKARVTGPGEANIDAP
jgi:flagella basal body P-ring formation protein FlgA